MLSVISYRLEEAGFLADTCCSEGITLVAVDLRVSSERFAQINYIFKLVICDRSLDN